jgi:hypothetical protein
MWFRSNHTLARINRRISQIVTPDPDGFWNKPCCPPRLSVSLHESRRSEGPCSFILVAAILTIYCSMFQLLLAIATLIGGIAGLWFLLYASGARANQAWTSCSRRARALTQRYQPAAPRAQACRREDRYPLAGLAHAATNTCHTVASSGRNAQGRPSTVGPHKTLNYARNLHGADSRASAGGGRKPGKFGDQW